jgi:hypothetical protein
MVNELWLCCGRSRSLSSIAPIKEAAGKVEGADDLREQNPQR